MAQQDFDVNLPDFSNIFSCKGKTAVVTGGSKGLGLSAASGLLQSGCSKVYITARTASECASACDLLNALPNKIPLSAAIAIPSDLSSVQGIERLVSEVSKSTDHVDMLLANAGRIVNKPLEEHTASDFADVVNLNLNVAFHCAQKFLPLLTKRSCMSAPSKIIFTSSVSAFVISHLGDKSAPAYPASKAALIHLAHQLGVELGPKFVNTNCIAPGFFPTDLARDAIAARGGVEEMGKMSPNLRLGRPEDFAASVVYLASRAGDHINAACLTLDGGRIWGAPNVG